MRSLKRILCSSALFLLMTGQAIAVPDVSVNFTRETGVAPLTPGDDSPGNDSSLTNNIVRTNDIISYKFEVVVLDDDATNVVLRIAVTSGLELELPAFCRETGVAPISTITGSSSTGYSMLCNVGDIPQGSQVLYALPATVAFDQEHGASVSMTGASIESDQTPMENFPGSTDIVSATPKLDLIKNDHSRLIGRRSGPNGEDGVLYAFSIEVATENQGKGNELVTAPLVFEDDLSGISPNALLYQGWTGAYADACIPNPIGGQRLWNNPAGNTRTSDGGPGGAGAGPTARSVWNSGDIDCTVPGPGGTSVITITGADLSGSNYPTENTLGASLPANVRYLVSGILYVWIPISDIQAAGGQLRIDNYYTNFTTTGISGQPNTDPNASNDRRTFIAQDGASGRYFYNHRDHASYAIIDSQTSRRSGDGYVLPGQVFATRHYQNNGAWLTKQTLDNMEMCTSFDNSTQHITEITSGQGAKITFDGTPDGAQPPFTIEYGTGPGFGGNQTCRNGDSPGGWHTDMNSVPGGPAAITKVRAKGAYVAAPGGSSTLYRINLIVRYTALENPAGTIVAEYGTFRNDQQNGGNWILSDYDETTALGNYGDRLFLTKAAVRIDKNTDPAGDNQVLAGEPLSFRLQPSATTPGSASQMTTDVTIVDTLPQWYEYVVGSASPPPSNFIGNPDGTTDLIWEFPGTVINSPMAPITYDVTVTSTTPDQTAAINSVVIFSPNDGSPESQRIDTYSMLVLNPAGFSISKSAYPPLVAPDTNFSYRLTYANTGTSDFASIKFIDVLPAADVVQSPPTVFDGLAYFVSVSGTNGETFEYTRTPAAQVVDDPTHPSNQPGGSTIWCPTFSGGACPSSASQVTSIRGTSPAFNQGQPPRIVTVTMQGDANDAFNAYSNRYSAKADGLAFSVTSQTATVYVRTADLSLEKTVDGPDPLNPALVTFTLTASNAGPHTAEGVEITDILPSGFGYFNHSGAGSYNPASGIWIPGPVPVGGSRSLNLRANVIAGGDYTNIAEVTGQLFADPDSKPGNLATVPGEDDAASASVSRLSGRIFLDNGSGGGMAHDGIPNGIETGGKFGTVALADVATGTARVIADVAADGTWFAVLASGLPGSFDTTFTPGADYILMSEGGNGLPSLVNAAPRDGSFRFTPALASDYTGLDFGLVAKPLLSQNQSAAINPGQIVDLPHRYEATSAGSVSFSVIDAVSNPNGAFASAVFTDANCDGAPETPVVAPITVAAGQSVCLIVRTQSSSGVGAGAVQVYDLSAVTDFTGVPVTHAIRNSDRLDVGGSGGSDQLVLRKLVRNLTANTPEATANSGRVGDVLQYRIILTNPGTAPATNVTVNDTTPAWTALASPVTQSTTVAPGIVCALAVPAAGSNVPGYAGPLEWSCPGSFPVGAQGSVSFQVSIIP